ncbi:MAG TPA: lipid-A-disaccharide synthase [Bacteroidales bacterium]|nr:lipid-A-disaccharide synthase [Bacteroidales bacterium]
MKYYIIAGEASGDLHASNLMKEIKKNDPDANFRCWGGDLMKAQGAFIVKHISEISFMGFAEVVLNLRTILRNLSFCKSDIDEFHPDALILVDYPGFNLKIAGYARQKGYNVFYYVSPQIWAWKQSRVHKIKKTIDKMMVILPFEKDFYKRFDYDAEFVGHPLLDAVESYKASKTQSNFRLENKLSGKPIVALLPGSRKQEISRMLKTMISIREDFSDTQFVIAGAPSIKPEYYSSLIRGHDVSIVYNKTYDLFMNADAALVTSGTATLEAALFDVPEIVCYKGSWFSYIIARMVIKVKFISLVNLIMDRKIVTELIQTNLTKANLRAELKTILFNPGQIRQLKNEYSLLKQKLGNSGASKKAADVIRNYLPSGKQPK